jgi:hypothetical protein
MKRKRRPWTRRPTCASYSRTRTSAAYARLHDPTLRAEFDRYQRRINIRGETVPLDPDGPLSDAAWAKQKLARARQTLPNGYCGLPLQQSCPHPNACLTCDHFLTTEEFLPLHRDQLERTERLLGGPHRPPQLPQPIPHRLDTGAEARPPQLAARQIDRRRLRRASMHIQPHTCHRAHQGRTLLRLGSAGARLRPDQPPHEREGRAELGQTGRLHGHGV